MRRILPLLLLVTMLPWSGGCTIAGLIGVMAQSAEYQKILEVPAQYAGLENKSAAILVMADYSVLYENPTLVQTVMASVTGRIGANVPGVRMLPPQAVAAWQYQTPQWNAMPFGEVAEGLNVERLVIIDIYEYRLNPPGNSWLWEGVCSADVGVVEVEAFDPDSYVETFTVSVNFPDVRGLGREAASKPQIQTGLLTRFVQESAWLFYMHQKPKYPDKYLGQ